MNLLKKREQAIEALKDLHDHGYRYVVRDKDSEYLSCFSLKPKKYRDGEFWGYVNPDEKEAKPAYPVRNTDITEINWSNKSAMLISNYLEVR